MTKEISPLTDPLGYLATARPKVQSLEDRSKSDSRFAGEDVALAERDADARRQANLAEFDKSVRPALKAVEPLLDRGTYLVFLETATQRLATFWAGKWYPFGRVGVNQDGNWFHNDDRDNSHEVGSAKEAMTRLLETLQPELRLAARRIQSEQERPARFAAQQEHLKEERRKRLAV